MWPTNRFVANFCAGNEDSDQSISEEEDFIDHLPQECISLGSQAETKGGLQVLSQLEMLHAARERRQETKQITSSQKKQTDEDDVEFPVFVEGNDPLLPPRIEIDSTCHSDDEIISDDEAMESNAVAAKVIISGAEDLEEAGLSKPWSTKNAEAADVGTAHVFFNNCSCPSSGLVFADARKFYTGSRGKAKPKFSFHSQLHLRNKSRNNIVNESRISSKEGELEEIEGHEMVVEEEVGHDYSNHSIGERFDGFPDNSKSLDGGFLFDVEIHQKSKPILPESKQKTIADQFGEVLGAASVNEGRLFSVCRPPITSFSGKLQRIVQIEKERDLVFQNGLQKEECSCFDVKILSRWLEAKLMVCSCSLIEDEEIAAEFDSSRQIGGRSLTVIFSSRLCRDVELEVGKLVRIHHPWSERRIPGKEEKTILSAYYSQILLQ